MNYFEFFRVTMATLLVTRFWGKGLKGKLLVTEKKRFSMLLCGSPGKVQPVTMLLVLTLVLVPQPLALMK